MARRKKPRSSSPAPEPAPEPAVGTSIGELLQEAGLDRIRSAGSASVAVEPRGAAEAGERPAPRSGASHRRPEAPPATPSLPARDDGPRPGARAARTTAELAAWNEAYRGVAPIRRPKGARLPAAARVVAPAHPVDTEVERAARERLSALVAGGLRFAVAWDEAYVLGTRDGVDRERLRRRLTGRGFTPEATLDLHGQRRREVAALVDRFVRAEHRRGRRYLLLIVGKGHHSEGEHGVLADAAVEALTQGGAAPVVAGFASADASHGGTGAIAVALVR